MATDSSSKSNWPVSRVLALAKQPGQHKHPSVQGFFMRVSPKGKAVWGYKFRDKFSKEQAKTIGEVAAESGGGKYSLEDALKQYEEVRAYHDGLGDTGELTLQVAFESWITKHKKKGGGDLSSETVNYYRGGFERYFRAEHGKLLLAAVTPEKWMAILDKVKAKSISFARGFMWMWHGIYEHYIELEVLTRNPLAKQLIRNRYAGIDSKRPRKSHVAALDLKTFVGNIEKIVGKRNRIATMILTLTGWRHSAVLRMKWSQLDFERGIYNVAEKDVGWKGYVGPVALSDHALAYLDELRQDPRYSGRTYIFEARQGQHDYMTTVRGSVAKCATGLGYNVKVHDLRRSFITVGDMVTNGNLRLVGRLVGHKKGKTGDDEDAMTADYLMRRHALERQTANEIAETIAELGGLLPLSDEVAEMLRRNAIDPSALTLVELDDDDDEGEEEALAA